MNTDAEKIERLALQMVSDATAPPIVMASHGNLWVPSSAARNRAGPEGGAQPMDEHPTQKT